MSTTPRHPHDAIPAPEGQPLRSQPHTAGFADGLGERRLVFDPASSTSLEVLKFRPEFSDSPEFEGALLARVEALNHVTHPSLAPVLFVERKSESELALVSRHIPGRRVSELLPKAHGPAFALELIRLVTPALATLQRAGDEIAHGALSADRIIVTRDGRLVVVEPVLGAAIEALKLPRKRLVELGLVVPASKETIQFSGRTDMAQLGFLALALLLGRRLDPSEYPEKVPALLDEFARTAGSPVLAAKLRSWLERAMQLSPRPFASAKEAQAAFGELPDDEDVHTAAVITGLDAFPQETATAASIKPTAGAMPEPMPNRSPEHVAERRGPVEDRRQQSSGKKRLAVWLAVALGAVAAAEGVALFVVPYMRPPAEVIEVRSPQPPAASAPAPTLPVAPAPVQQTTASPTVGAAATTTAAAAGVAPAASGSTPTSPASSGASAVAPAITPSATPAPGGAARFGGVTVVSKMDLQVTENGKAIGSSAAPVAIGEGSHTLEFVNETLGFRYRQTVNVKSAQMTTVNIAVPNGRISINAAPWADVEIDGTPAGETPLANLSLPIGSHEITFRHPQLGTKKQTVIVKVDGLTKVTQVFQTEK